MSGITCPICGTIYIEFRSDPNRDIHHATCSNCGKYLVTEEGAGVLAHDQGVRAKRYLLSGVVRNASERGQKLEITSYTIRDLIESAPVPKSPIEVVDRVLPLIAERTPEFGKAATLRANDYPLFYLRSPDELRGVTEAAFERGLTRSEPSGNDLAIWLTVKGWERVQELRDKQPLTRQAFVAMHFDPTLKPLYDDAIKLALKETGYSPLRIDEVHHNDKIDDRIVAELRRSGLVVADFTNHRGGVYFEAGYALGRGIPVIWTCREDDVQHAHFDTRQFNHITWATPEELRAKLRDRIRATLPTFPARE
jgi:nucleoside 2-deoxyribosyltransferase